MKEIQIAMDIAEANKERISKLTPSLGMGIIFDKETVRASQWVFRRRNEVSRQSLAVVHELYLIRVNGTFSPDPIRIKNKELINFFHEGIIQECENEKIRKENEFGLALFPERERNNVVTEINGVLFEKRDSRDLYKDYEPKGE